MLIRNLICYTNKITLAITGATFTFGNTNWATFLFSKILNEVLLVVLNRNTFDKVAAAEKS